jgi:hypothetical protein
MNILVLYYVIWFISMSAFCCGYQPQLFVVSCVFRKMPFWKDRVFDVTTCLYWKKLNNCVVMMILTNRYSFCSASLLRMSRGLKLLRKWMS